MMLAAALDLAQQGWAVFPCNWCGDEAKSPLTAHGHLDAQRDPAVITKWWTRWPQAMIGAPVPEPLIVVDVDPRNNPEGLDELVAVVGLLPQTLTAWSGRGDGGRHLYFRRPAGPVASTRLPDGVDLKAAGYCIVPPSVHPASGEPYEWEHHPVAVLPATVRELLRPPPPRRWTGGRKGRDGGALVAWVASQTEGNRGEGLFWAACRAAENGQLHDLADDLIRAAVSTGLTEIEARRAVNSTSRRIEAHA